MPDFNYTAHDQSGQISKGAINAHDKNAAISSLRSRNLSPIVLEESKTNKGMNIEIGFLTSKKAKPKDLVIFTRQLSTMVNAGVPLIRSLNLLREQTESVALKRALAEITGDVQGGGSLSDSLAKHPQIFSSIFVNMVRAGETGGILDKVLDRLAYQQEKDATLRGKIHGALVYPGVIFGVTMIAFFVLMTFIVPKIGAILTSLSNGKAKLPIYTRALLAISHTMRQPWFLVLLIVGLPTVIIMFKRYVKTPQGRYRWHSLLLNIPAVKGIITKTAIARFARTFASLMSAGVSIVDSINTTAGSIGNAVIEKELLECSKAVQAGSPFSTQLQKSKHFPAIVVQMLAVGEETGQTDEIILKVADFYETEVDTAVASISSIIEPVMIVLLGGMVGIIALSVFGPITQLSTSAQ